MQERGHRRAPKETTHSRRKIRGAAVDRRLTCQEEDQAPARQRTGEGETPPRRTEAGTGLSTGRLREHTTLYSRQIRKKEVRTAFCSIGERKSVFEDKVAVSSTGQYNDGDSRGWMRTTSSYLVSKTYEISLFLPWAESAQSQQISHHHVHALSESGKMCSVEPLQISRELWGYLNLALTGKRKMAFNHCTQ